MLGTARDAAAVDAGAVCCRCRMFSHLNESSCWFHYPAAAAPSPAKLFFLLGKCDNEADLLLAASPWLYLL